MTVLLLFCSTKCARVFEGLIAIILAVQFRLFIERTRNISINNPRMKRSNPNICYLQVAYLQYLHLS